MNKVELIGVYGGDQSHACSAWTSTSRALTPEKINRIDRLLNLLMEEQHHTPFEKSTIHFLVTTDIATHIHLLKHRIGVSINAESARYKELGKRKNNKSEDKYYLPEDWPLAEKTKLKRHVQNCYRQYHDTIQNLVNEGFSRKRAKESARYYLPYSIQIQSDIMFNFRSFIHFLILRDSEHAQEEVRNIAKEMRRLLEKDSNFNYSLLAFDNMMAKENMRELSYNIIKKLNIEDDDLERLGCSDIISKIFKENNA